ncbi:hypothetical protein RM549_03285 [Salegentibacter sp. F188]|uniref:Uncharacterized protein n=1 Tax=Autumnicola patrickiae TaxID=3075591 RepID=A0ABU3DYI2_9FLAO|nr:hypothetical protein [Salegentibacter sp. F188]MDT0688790.1 hypothetical protein [Salegentibacter sp. F188]
MKKNEIEQATVWLENLLDEFKKTRAMGKKTNSNEERAQSIAEIKEITQRLEAYIRNNEKLLEEIAGTEIELARNISWNEVVRPAHFEEDLTKEIDKLKKQVS